MANEREWQNFIDELKSRNDIVDVIQSYVPLEQKGKTFWASCPFHHEKTPSFAVNRQGQYYHCYGCGKGGDVIRFIEEIESAGFMDAVELLAKRVGMHVPTNYNDAEMAERKKHRQKLYDVLRLTAKFYNQNLFSEQGKTAREYLLARGIDRKTMIRFGLGCSTDWKSLVNYLQSEGVDLKLAKECGVIDAKDGRYYDFLAERMIVPIIGATGEVVAFGGRTLEKNPKFAKYKNTSQTPVFDKSKTLFALNLIRKLKMEQTVNSLIVVEGYMDVISLHMAGFRNAVASMGTSLTKEQARLLKRYVDDVYICYDGDAAGQKATLRGMDLLKDEGLNVRVVSMPDGLDPDEVIKLRGAEAYRRALNNALPLTDYKLMLLEKEYPLKQENDILREEARRKYTTGAMAVLKTLRDAVERESYLQLLQKKTGFSADFLRSELGNAEPEQTFVKQKETPVKGAEEKALYFIAASVLLNKEYAKLDFVPETSDPFLAEVFRYLHECAQKGVPPEAGILYRWHNGDFAEKTDELLDTKFSTTVEDTKYFQDCVKKIRGTSLSREIDELTRKYSAETDPNEKKKIAAQIAEIAAKIKQN